MYEPLKNDYKARAQVTSALRRIEHNARELRLLVNDSIEYDLSDAGMAWNFVSEFGGETAIVAEALWGTEGGPL